VAFRASELRLILGVQAYGTTNLSRLRRDITSLGRAADVANANQLRVQDQIVAKRQQVAQTAQRIASMENRLAANRANLEARMAVDAERFAARRSMLAQREMQAVETLANRRVQIGRTQDRIEAMRSSGMQKFAVQETQLAQRRMGLQNQINTLERQSIGLGAQKLRNLAAQSAALRRVANVAGDEAAFTRIQAMPTPQLMRGRGIDDQLREAELRYRAIQQDARKISYAQAALPKQIAALNMQLEVTAQQDALIQARKFEQAAAIGRANEMLGVQSSALQTIEARLAQIAVEQDAILANEKLTTVQRESALAAINAESAAIDVQKLKLTELLAEEERLATVRMNEARRADAMAARMRGAQSMETAGRTLAHAGRTAQFGGLLGTAVFAGTGAAAAEFSRNTNLAATQMRDVGASFTQTAERGKQLQAVILNMTKEFPAGAQDMSDAAYEIFSSMNIVRNGVVDTAKGFDLLRTANKLAVAGQVDLDEATNAMITTLNNFDPNLQHVGQTMNQVFAIVRFGRMRLSDFAKSMIPLAPLANTLGLGLSDVGAALSTLTILFGDQENSAKGLARAMELFNLPAFAKGLHAAGIEVKTTSGRMRPLFDIITDIRKTSPELATSQKSIVEWLIQVSKASGLTKAGIQGTVQARRAIAGLVTQYGLYQNILQNITGDQNEFNDAFNAMRNTPGVQWAIFVNQMKAFAIVIGQAALPALLELSDWLVGAAKWIENLSKRTDGAAIRWAAFAAAALLVGGTLANMIGSIIALAANFKILGASFAAVEAEATAASIAASALQAGLMGLVGIGIISIPIVLQIIKGGDPSLWDFLGAGAAGAAGGAMIGGALGSIIPGAGTAVGAAAGAGIGAITVPLVVHIISKFQPPDPSTVAPVKAAYAQYLKTALAPGETVKTFEQFQKDFNANLKKFAIPKTGEDVGQAFKAQQAKPKTAMEKYQELVKQFTKQNLAAMDKYWESLAGGPDGGAADDAAAAAKTRAKAIQQAYENMQQKIDQVVDKLAQTYDKFREQNKQTFGELFQGPVLSGFMGDMFQSINDTLQQFGQTIPIPIELLNRDLEMQITNFEKLREGYAALIKKGVPQEVVQQIQQMGVAGLPFVQGLLQASGPQFKKFVDNVKRSQKDIKDATKIDFNNQLAQWRKYGTDIADEIINGLSADAAQEKLKGGFEKYVMQLFGATFKKEMAAEVDKAVKEAAETRAAGKSAKTAAQKAADAARKGLKNPLAGSLPDQKSTKTASRTTGTGITHDSDLPGTFKGYVAGLPSSTFQRGLKVGPRIVVVNTGDRNTIHADGVHPKKVTQAMNKKSFVNRNRKR